MINIAKAFIAAQKEMGNAIKDSKNPFFKSAYADLNSVREACIPALNANGIAVLQPIVQIDGKNFVKTLLLHESGESIEGLTEILFAKQNDPQAQGSGITYARRYGLQSLVNIGAEDDDGNKAAEKPKEAKKESTKNAFGLSKDGDLASGADMTETFAKAAQDFFAKIKKDVEECGSLTEVQGLEETNKAKIEKLAKNYPNLHNMLSEAIKKVKDEFKGE
jgi:hypothetical protein